MSKYSKKYYKIRSKYQNKRTNSDWKTRKKLIIKKRYEPFARINKGKSKSKKYLRHSAPEEFSLIDNTNNVLLYFEEAEKKFRKGEKLIMDISKIEKLSPDAIALLVSSINDPDFHHFRPFIGNAPDNPILKDLFTQSGFYKFVRSQGFNREANGNLLHRETHYRVKPGIAQQAALTGVKHTFENEIPYEPLYEILIECMSNTNNHASLDRLKKCKWWLYVYNEPNTGITSYSFIDLGVGIFESIVVKSYIKRVLKKTTLLHNVDLADDLLSGKIQSRVDEDNEIRGKGIPQIAGYSKLGTFKSFIIITNDVKINLKDGKKEKLSVNFKGTFLYWELQPDSRKVKLWK